jgi:hypothetical protein
MLSVFSTAHRNIPGPEMAEGASFLLLQPKPLVGFLAKGVFMKKSNSSIYVPWYEEEKLQSNELKPCESLTEVEFDGCWVTVRVDCDAQGVDCNKCPALPGFKNLQNVRW